MSENYDNWERLVNVALHRERDKQLSLNYSRDPSSIGSPSSTTSNFSYTSSSSQFDFDHDQHSLVHGQIKSEIPMDYSDLTLSHDEWKAMLPPDKHEVVFKSASMIFFLDQRTLKNCFLLGAMKLKLSERLELLGEEDLPHHWEGESHPKSRFSEVAKLLDSSSQFAIQAKIHTKMLSPETSYAAYLVFGLTENYKNLGFAMSTIRFSNPDSIPETQTRIVHFQLGYSRADGWKEVEMGNFYVHHSKNIEIHVILRKISEDMSMKSGLIVEGIEFRPSKGKGNFSKVNISLNA